MPTMIEFSALGGPAVLNLVERPASDPAPGEVQIAMKAAGLNRAELLFMEGAYLLPPILPSRLGFEGSGEIIAVGADVDGVSVGDWVAITPAFQQNAYGVLGEVINIPASALVKIPQGVSFHEAAAFWMAFGTAYGLLVQCGELRAGGEQTVLINAASSSVGLAAIQIAQAHAARVIAVTRTADKVEALRSAGADHVIVSEEDDIVDRIDSLTNGKGFNIACDAVGGPSLALLADAAARDAVIVVYGLLSGEVGPIPFGQMVSRGVRLTGFHLAWSLLDIPERRRVAVSHLIHGLTSGVYRPVIDRIFPFGDVREAYAAMAANNHVGKIVVEF